jgi:3'-5' exonuclease
MTPSELVNRSRRTETQREHVYFIVDTESIPDGHLLAEVKYPGQGLSPEEAIEKAQAEARDNSYNGSDFLPYTFQVPVGICVLRCGANFELQHIKCLDAPQFRPKDIVKQFWLGLSFYERYKIVTFNGRSFDLPLLELAAFRHGLNAGEYFRRGRNRFNGDFDIMDWMANFGASRMAGGLDLLAKMIGKPGKIDVSGSHVYDMYRAGKFQEINDYCLFDTLDTYFVFLRTRVLTGEISPDRESEIVELAKIYLIKHTEDIPALKYYLDNWSEPIVGP